MNLIDVINQDIDLQEFIDEYKLCKLLNETN